MEGNDSPTAKPVLRAVSITSPGSTPSGAKD
jgi:hypothetical protein